MCMRNVLIKVGLSGVALLLLAASPGFSASEGRAAGDKSLGRVTGGISTAPATGMEFVVLPGGCFQMGSPSSEKGRADDEGQLHEVCVDSFGMGKYEVTVGAFRKFAEASGYRTEAEMGDGCYVTQNGSWIKVAGKNWREPNFHQGENDPVVCVSWNDIRAFIEWLNRLSSKSYQLPTEAEWEYAARGGSSASRYWGDDSRQACGYANVHDQSSKLANSFSWESHQCDDGYDATAPVGRLKPNGFGLHDMLGNVWEWTQDWFAAGYYNNSPRQNPTGPQSGKFRVSRGGGWGNRPDDVRAANRGGGTPDVRYNDLGFRLVLP